MKDSIHVNYQNKTIVFSVSGWLNASHIAKLYSISHDAWLRSPETQECLADVALALGEVDAQELIQIKADGTWIHPKVAIEFLREIDRKLARWCDITIDRIARDNSSIKDRFDAACKVLNKGRCEASEHGRGLLEWRNKKPRLEYRVAHLKDQLQLTLGLDNPN
jgi:hypothetical protein